MIDLSVIVIGASAGGVAALSKILPAVGPESGFSVLCALHIRQDTPSLLPDVLRPSCQVPVKEAEPSEPLQPATIYIAPADYHLSVEQDLTLSLSTEDPVAFSRPSIDVLFESAAALGARTMGILLTGSNSDGAKGLLRIKMCGGRTIVQRPDDALFSEMPNAALRLFDPDAVLPLAEITKIVEYLGEPRPRGDA